MCGRDLVNFFHGHPIALEGHTDDADVSQALGLQPRRPTIHHHGNELVKVTGNDLPMRDAKCIQVNGFNVCWKDVAKPYEFLSKKC